ncbi:hypothetical protein DFA_10671 [Cavenderia fasciculata]|uniref:SHSP domain-containing protein n=1 Tax=Cavenderia fasciculata TaxID=261658 RepID=F4QB26_CACFS|nr:uncharacterized protein DFA_10671 [Cavenderia fasciculata]EGG14798.1 hypothetical protein DFA_10671 [Cavenderia fasciculata]|eukprot:XP_004351314.1 hypothetical protein DFA_10671 [Cavenderia fasciculata]
MHCRIIVLNHWGGGDGCSYTEVISSMETVRQIKDKITGHYIPTKVDYFSCKEAGYILVEVPGVENIELKIHNRSLIVTGEKKPLIPLNSTVYHIKKTKDQEIQYGPFMRQFLLPQNLHRAGITAHLDKGILKITLPKQELSSFTLNIGPQAIQMDQLFCK